MLGARAVEMGFGEFAEKEVNPLYRFAVLTVRLLGGYTEGTCGKSAGSLGQPRPDPGWFVFLSSYKPTSNKQIYIGIRCLPPPPTCLLGNTTQPEYNLFLTHRQSVLI